MAKDIQTKPGTEMTTITPRKWEPQKEGEYLEGTVTDIIVRDGYLSTEEVKKYFHVLLDTEEGPFLIGSAALAPLLQFKPGYFCRMTFKGLIKSSRMPGGNAFKDIQVQVPKTQRPEKYATVDQLRAALVASMEANQGLTQMLNTWYEREARAALEPSAQVALPPKA